MPLLGFKKQFTPLVEAGLKVQTTAAPGTAERIKRQTIRAFREDGRNPHAGERLYLYTGLRTKGCRKLGEAVCKSVEQITIEWHGINVSGKWLRPTEHGRLAEADGFDCFLQMIEFFQKEHGVPFSGLLIKW